MRVTNNMLSQNLLKNLEMANNKMDLIQKQLASGQGITKPSDDPVKIETALRLKSTINSMEQWKINTSEGLSTLETTEGILSNMTSMLQRVRELTVQGANGANSNNDRQHIANEVDQLVEQLELLANSQVGTKYIFGGTHPDKKPYTEEGGVFKWQGNDKRLAVEVGANLSLPVSINGKELFGINGANNSSSFFKDLRQLSADLKNGNETGINEALEKIDTHIDRILETRAELGARTNRMQILYNQIDNSIINTKQNLSDLQDADIAETIMEFKSVQNVYRAALSVGSQIIQPSLVDFMR